MCWYSTLLLLMCLRVQNRKNQSPPTKTQTKTNPPTHAHCTGANVAWITFAMTLGIVYAPILPVIALMALLWLLIINVLWKWDLVFVFTQEVSGGGRVSTSYMYIVRHVDSHVYDVQSSVYGAVW